MKVLVAEDDPNILAGLVELLEGEGYQVLPAADGARAVELFEGSAPDFVFLDIMMPHKNGYDVCRYIRRKDASIPIVFLSAKTEEIDKVLGLELGADDYVMKPFGVKELAARVRAIARRCLAGGAEERFHLGAVEVLPKELRARKNGVSFDLSLRELKLLRTFREHTGEVLDRETLFRLCWDGAVYPNSRTLDQHISKLRKKIEDDPAAPTIIRTVHGVGYRYEG